jgi:CRP/FNR family transcriptional regulator
MSEHFDTALLATSEIFGDLDAKEIDAVAEICKIQTHQWGEYVFHEGDVGDRLYLIARGAIRLSRMVPGSGEEAITILKKGAVFGEMAVFDASRRSTDAIVDMRCELVTITRSDFEALLDSNHDLAYKVLRSVIRLISTRLRATNDSLQSIFVIAMF